MRVVELCNLSDGVDFDPKVCCVFCEYKMRTVKNLLSCYICLLGLVYMIILVFNGWTGEIRIKAYLSLNV
jgi:hypothetical protein